MSAFLTKVDEKHGDFTLTKIEPINELNVILREVTHVPSGARILHLENDDPENVFCLSFRTWPESSNGVPHILEHTVLCGSKRFPIKDPFFSMHRRSLNTFMNAFTGPDFTCYPAASQIENDFYNLLDVYLDAAFHPQLKKKSFLQEGWRLEFADGDDSNSPLQYKGVVYNEMKGSFASPTSRLWRELMRNLYSKLPYHFDSGGDPKEIPDLTYEGLIRFHETYYHPGNCLFFFYGNLPLKNHLDFINECVLKGVSKPPPLSPLPQESRLKKPLWVESRYPVSEESDLEKKSILTFSYLTTHIANQEETLALALLDSILMDTDASLLKTSLLASGLCQTADAHLDCELSEVPYAIICKGCNGKDSTALLNVIEKRLREIVINKIPQELVEASLHQLEFGRTEIVGNHMPYGLTLFMRSALAMQHGCNPEDSLKIHSLFDALREKLKDQNYLPSLIEKYLLNNTHQVHLTLLPSHTLTKEEEEEEKNRLKKIEERLQEEAKQAIVQQARSLEAFQMEIEGQDLECLPKLSLDDIPLKVTDFPLHEEDCGAFTLFHHPCFTNQVLYADLIFDLPHLTDEELPYAHLFTMLMTEVGCGSRSYSDNLHAIHAHTGGLDVSIALHNQVDDPTKLRPCLQLHGKSLQRNARHLITLLKEMATSVRFDENKRIEELTKQIYTGLENRLNTNALRYAIQLSLSGFSQGNHIHNVWYGLPFYKMMQAIVHNEATELPKLIDMLNRLKDKLLCVGKPHLVLSCDQNMLETLKKEQFYGLGDLPSHSATPFESTFAMQKVASQGRLISSPVAFTARAYPSISYIHPHAPALYVASHLLENKHLHRAIREQGGAYGSAAHFNASNGTFYFHGYRDPHLYRTLKAFDDATDLIATGEFDTSDLEEAKFGVIQSLDSPIPPGNRALTTYSRLREGKTNALRQKFRDHLLNVTPEEVSLIVQKELIAKKDLGVTVSFADASLFEKEKKKIKKGQKELPILNI